MVNGVVIFLALFVVLIAVASGQSPCPEFFRYRRNEKTSEMFGYIQVPSVPKNVALHLRVGLSLPTALSTKYVGRLELAHSKEESVRAVKQGRSLEYRVLFPVRRPVPLLTGLWFNSHQFCAGPRATGPVVTSIVLEHTLYPPGVLPLSASQDNSIVEHLEENGITPNIFLQTTARNHVTTVKPPPPPPAPPVITTSPVYNYPECGKVNSNRVNTLIAKGVETSPAQWPWLVALFVVKIKFEFQCAGTLVTDRHVLTAAHCFQLENGLAPAGALLVSVGRYNLHEWREDGAENIEVAEYRLHQNYSESLTADADLAIIVLRKPVTFSPRIRPICMWSGPKRLENIVGKMGYVVGWGRDEFGNQHTSEPRMNTSPVISLEDCHWSNPDFVTLTSKRTFCAGSRDGSGPCNGDSGSGFVMYNRDTERYHLRGVVSRSLKDKETMACDLQHYIVYVDVAKHLDWIQSQIAT